MSLYGRFGEQVLAGLKKVVWMLADGADTTLDDGAFARYGCIESFYARGKLFVDDDHGICAATLAILSNQAMADISFSLGRALAFCDSPIERAFLGAFICVAQQSFGGVVVRCGVTNARSEFGIPGRVEIVCQKPIGKYRADFLITATAMNSDKSAQMVVECDGHDFHERTKGQASRDKKRDREFQRLGFRVFRYSGSDIWKDAAACATETVETLISMIKPEGEPL